MKQKKEKKQSLEKTKILLVGLTIFSMFFGAGNLIFPPFLGYQAGTKTIWACLGFGLSAVGLPMLGVIIVSRFGGLKNIASKVSPLFASILILAIYLAIGPLLAIPRTAMTSFSMAVQPLLGDSLIVRISYSFIFFSLASYFAFSPEKLQNRFGKIMVPILLILILIVFLGCLFHSPRITSKPTQAYQQNAFVTGFLEGYQTMDTLAALIFGLVILLNVTTLGYDSTQAKKVITLGSLITGFLLFAVYAMLAYVGKVSGAIQATNGTSILLYVTNNIYGHWGALLLGLIFLIACFNTCVGLLCCLGEYFQNNFKLKYRLGVILTAFFSMLIAIIGLDNILKFSLPLLSLSYPLAISLIFLAYLDKFIGNYPKMYSFCLYLVLFQTIINVLDTNGLVIPYLTTILRYLPFYQIGLGFITPFFLGLFLALPFKKKDQKRKFDI